MANPSNPFPAHIHHVGVCSPGSVPDEKRINEALKLFSAFGIEVRMTKRVFENGADDYSASDTAGRLDDFNSLVRDSSIDMIFCARGGYGSTYLLDGIDYDTMRKRDLPVCGYSDITAIHSAMLAKNAGQVVYCKVMTEFPGIFKCPLTLESFKRNMAREPQTTRLEPLKKAASSVQGRIVAANLSVFASLTGTQYMPQLDGAVLILEDVGELPRRIDRSILHLAMNGVFDKISALVFASFTDCSDTAAIQRILERAAAYTQAPCFKGLQYGHDDISYAMRGFGTALITPDGEMTF